MSLNKETKPWSGNCLERIIIINYLKPFNLQTNENN